MQGASVPKHLLRPECCRLVSRDPYTRFSRYPPRSDKRDPRPTFHHRNTDSEVGVKPRRLFLRSLDVAPISHSSPPG